MVGGGLEVYTYADTVVLSLTGFLLYLFVGLLAMIFPSQGFRIAVRATSVIVFLVLGLKVAYDFRQRQASNAKYDRNLANGTLVVMISLVVLTALFDKRWHEQLNNMVVEVTQIIIPNPRFPAVSLSQDMLATYQAQLVPEPLKCFLNKFDDEAPMCHSLNRSELLTAYSCNCNDSWVSGVQQRFEAPGSEQGSCYVSFRPGNYVISAGAKVYMTLQAFLNCHPVLWLMVYVPDLSFEEAYTKGYGEVNLFNANEVTTINIGLNYFKPANGTAYYNYGVRISTADNLNLSSVRRQQERDATMLRELNYPDPEVRPHCPDREDEHAVAIELEHCCKYSIFGNLIEDQDVVAEVGAYFALVQILSWMVSGQVLATF
ncbi:MAG: hypothetical protein Q9199_000579 [Rusavskia elegans]